jgi:hypothetical protein
MDRVHGGCIAPSYPYIARARLTLLLAPRPTRTRHQLRGRLKEAEKELKEAALETARRRRCAAALCFSTHCSALQ